MAEIGLERLSWKRISFVFREKKITSPLQVPATSWAPRISEIGSVHVLDGGTKREKAWNNEGVLVNRKVSAKEERRRRMTI